MMVGIAGLFGGFWVYAGPAPAWVLITGSAVGAGAAGFFAYLKPESSRRIISTTLIVAFIGSSTGAILGFWYGEVFYPEGVRNVYFVSTGTLRSPPVFAIVTGASIFTTALGAVYYGFRLFRYHEV
jgi:hypothetical protein